MMTVPGEQFVIRRKAYAMIKGAFDENGIKFAFPTVQVAGESETARATAAVAQRGFELTHPAAAARQNRHAARINSASADDQHVAGELLGELTQIGGPGIVLGRFEDQQPTIEVDDPLPKCREFRC